MILPDHRTIPEEFRLLACLWFDRFFHPRREYVEHLCREERRHAEDHAPPRVWAKDFFGLSEGMQGEQMARFPDFVAKVVAMPREAYRLLVPCVRNYVDALEVVDRNFDLAYSMLVYVLESLSSTYVADPPVWEDYDENVRRGLDEVFAGLDESDVAGIKAVLLRNAHLKLKKRFVAGTTSRLSPSFYGPEAGKLSKALPASYAERALANLYSAHSGFVHSLKRVHEQLRVPQLNSSADFLEWANDVYLTFSGVSRMTRHVLLKYVDEQPSLEREDYPWRAELPGIVQFQFAPEYWVWKAQSLTVRSADKRFSGFMELLVTKLPKHDSPLPDMSSVMEKIESLLEQSSAEERQSLAAMYQVYHAVIVPEGRRPRYEQVLQSLEPELEQCSIQMMAVRTVLGHEFAWSFDTCRDAYSRYVTARFRKQAVHLPVTLEVAIMANIRRAAIREQQAQEAEAWGREIEGDLAGFVEVQTYVRDKLAGREDIDPARILGLADGEPGET